MSVCTCCGMRFYDYYRYFQRCRWCRPRTDERQCRPGTGGHPHTKIELEDVT